MPIELLLFDVETTGLNKETDQVIELAVLSGLSGRGKRWRFRPEVPIHPDAHAAHGLTAEILEHEPPFAVHAPTIHKIFAGAQVLGGYNVGFDIEMLQAEFRRACCPPLELADKPQIDAFRLWQIGEPRTLQDAHRRFCGADFEGAHGAEADIAATGRVLAGMIEAFAPLTGKSFAELAALCQPDRKLWLGPSRHVQRRPGDGAPVLAFGKQQGRPLTEVDPGYLRWVLEADFPPHVKDLCEQALSLPREAFLNEVNERYPRP